MAWDNRDLWEFAGDCGAEMKEESAAGICGLGGGEGRCGFLAAQLADCLHTLVSRETGHRVPGGFFAGFHFADYGVYQALEILDRMILSMRYTCPYCGEGLELSDLQQTA